MPKLLYAENERALCFHGPLMYEAKVLQCELWVKGSNASGEVGPHYFVHYKGWKQTWDEWVPEDRLQKFNDENLRRQKALIEAQRARDAAEKAELARQQQQEQEQQEKGTAAASTAPVATASKAQPSASSAAASGATASRRGDDKARGNKRAREDDLAEDYLARPQVRVIIPEALKVHLVDDWEAVTKNHQLIKLPRHPHVNMILDEWLKYLVNADDERKRLAAEVQAGLKVYFNKSLGNNLLYRFERGQYNQQMKDWGKRHTTIGTPFEPSARYGAEHLLRLFVNLPDLLAHTSMDAETTAVLKEHLSHFLSWMELNKAILFTKDYENTSSGYQNNNRG